MLVRSLVPYAFSFRHASYALPERWEMQRAWFMTRPRGRIQPWPFTNIPRCLTYVLCLPRFPVLFDGLFRHVLKWTALHHPKSARHGGRYSSPHRDCYHFSWEDQDLKCHERDFSPFSISLSKTFIFIYLHNHPGQGIR